MPSAADASRQQIYCPTCDRVVERSELIRGYEVSKGEYLTFTAEELQALESEASRTVNITTFVPLASVDPIYFEATYYLGPDARTAKPYRLLADAMAQTERAAVAVSVMRGKESPVLVRAARRGLLLHTLYFADEVRDCGEIAKGEDETVKPGELDLATRLETELAASAFRPEARHLSAASRRRRSGESHRHEPQGGHAGGAWGPGDRPHECPEAKPRAKTADTGGPSHGDPRGPGGFVQTSRVAEGGVTCRSHLTLP